MKKLFLSLGLLLAVGTAQQARAQWGSLVRTGINIHTLATRAPAVDREALKDSLNGLHTAAYAGKRLRTQRTPADKLPAKGGEQLVALETQLERCRTALLAAPAGALCTPEQRAALQQALISVARTGQTRNLPVYQEEAAFYQTEDARRQSSAPATPAP